MKEKLPRTWAEGRRFWKADTVFGNQRRGRSLWASEAGKCGVVGPQKALLLPLLSLCKRTIISHQEDFLLRVGVGVRLRPSGAAYLSGELFPKFQSKTPGEGGSRTCRSGTQSPREILDPPARILAFHSKEQVQERRIWVHFRA